MWSQASVSFYKGLHTGHKSPCYTDPLKHQIGRLSRINYLFVPQVLNEVVVDRGPSSYLSNVDLYLDGRLITSVQGDGKDGHTPVPFSFSNSETLESEVSLIIRLMTPNILPLSVCLQVWSCPRLQAARRMQLQQEPRWSTPTYRPSWSPPSAHTRSPSGPSSSLQEWSSW